MKTGGDYVDNDGYTEHVDVTLYKPVALTAAVNPSTLDICPDEPGGSTPPSPAQSFTSRVSSAQLKTAGGIAQAFEVKMSSPNAKFPFPLDKYLSQAGQLPFGSASPQLLFTVYSPENKVDVTCTVSSGQTSADWIGFATILPDAQLTPNNPDGKLPIQPNTLTLTLHEPLYDLAGSVTPPWTKNPQTDYGPAQSGMGNIGWLFEEPSAPFSSLFVPSKP